MQYPFGYGLSYTSFDWKVTDASANGATLTKDGDVTVKVTVTNTGDRAGKDVVQLYYTAPYIAGEIEKSSVELGAFAKTKELQPGESEEVTLTVPVSDMAAMTPMTPTTTVLPAMSWTQAIHLYRAPRCPRCGR